MDMIVRTVSQTPAISAASAYAAGDLVGGKLAFDLSAFRVLAGNCVLDRAVVADLAKQGADLDLLLFDADPDSTTFTDNAALDIADADLPKVVGVVQISSDSALADNGLSFVNGLDMAVHLPVGRAATLYGALVSRGTPTYVSTSDLTVRLTFRPPS